MSQNENVESLLHRIKELESKCAKNEESLRALSLDSFYFNTLMEQIPDSIYFKDMQSRFMRVNKAWAEKHKISSPSMASKKTDFDFFPPEFAKQARQDEQKIIQTGDPVSKIEKYATDNDISWYSSTKVPVWDFDNTIVGTCGISRNITIEKKTQEMLTQSNALLEQRVKEKTEDLVTTNRLLENRIRQLHFINQFSYSVSHKITVDDTCRVILDSFCEYFPNTEGVLFQIKGKQYRQQCATKLLGKMADTGFVQRVLKEHVPQSSPETLLFSLSKTDAEPYTSATFENALLVPLFADKKQMGSIILLIPTMNEENFEKEKYLITILASVSGVSLERARTHASMKEKARYEGEMIAAQNIQKTLIPDERSEFPQAIVECAYRPAYEVSGDYLDCFVNDQGNLVIAIGDVCGKGVPAALLMSMLRTTLKIYATNQPSAAHLIVDVQKSMRDKLSLTSFISLLCCIVDTKSMTMSYARAGHPYLLQIDETGAMPTTHMTKGIALGMEFDTTIFSTLLEEKLIPIKKGDRFFVYTDGIIDAMLPDGSFFGTERLKQLLSSHGALDPRSVISAITDLINDEKMTDDATALSFEIS